PRPARHTCIETAVAAPLRSRVTIPSTKPEKVPFNIRSLQNEFSQRNSGPSARLPRRRPALFCSVRRRYRLTAEEDDVEWRPLKFAGVLLTATVVLVATDAFADADWPSAGADLGNSRYQDKEHRISAQTASSLQLKWTFATDGD